MWKYKGKNIYYVDSEISIGINRLNNRVDELGGNNRVTLSPEIRRKFRGYRRCCQLMITHRGSLIIFLKDYKRNQKKNDVSDAVGFDERFC